MVTAAVIGHGGYLGSVVARRWAELGADIVTAATADYVINCIRPDDIMLAERMAESARLIQPSTDAIDEDSDYARTKRILERIPGVVTIRAGIIDTRHQYPSAYRNWRCNPLTPLEWADLAWDMRDHPGVHIAGREPLTRYEVARLVARLWDFPAPAPSWAEVPLDRTQTPGSWPPLTDALLEYREWLRS